MVHIPDFFLCWSCGEGARILLIANGDSFIPCVLCGSIMQSVCKISVDSADIWRGWTEICKKIKLSPNAVTCIFHAVINLKLTKKTG